MGRLLGFLFALLTLPLINAATALVIAETFIKAVQFLIQRYSDPTGYSSPELVSVNLLWRIVPVGLTICATIILCVVNKEKFSGTSSALRDAIEFFGKALVAVFFGAMGAVPGMLGGMGIMFVMIPLNAIFNFGLTSLECANLSMIIGAGIGFLGGFFFGLAWSFSNSGGSRSYTSSEYQGSSGGGSSSSYSPSPSYTSGPVYPDPHSSVSSGPIYTPGPPPPDMLAESQAQQARTWEEMKARQAWHDRK